MNIVLKNKRSERGMTQSQVAQAAQISERQYIRIEQGTRDPRTATSLLIARALGSTVEELFGAATPDNTKEPDGNPT